MFTTAPSTNLCAAGTARNMTSGAGPWKWTCAGSTTSADCVAYGEWTTHGPSRGSVYAFVVDPNDTTIVYAGTERGVFKSTNRGGTWKRAGTGAPWSYGGSTTVYALAMPPSSSTVLYAGTNNGVFKSIDAGATWTGVNGGLTDLVVHALAIDPSVPSTVYAGTQAGGVFQSTVAGDTWHAANAGWTETNVTTLAVDPSTTPSTVYALAGSAVFRGTDVKGALTWTATKTGLGPVKTLAMLLGPPTTLYAGTSGDVFESTNGGDSWTVIDTGHFPLKNVRAIAPYLDNHNLRFYAAIGSEVFAGYGGGWTQADAGSGIFPVNALAVDPSFPLIVYAGLDQGGASVTKDGCNHFASASIRLSAALANALALDGTTTPPTVYAGTGNGVFKSIDRGTSWTAANTGMTFASVHALAIDPHTNPSTVYAGTDDGVYKSTDGGKSWTTVNNGLTSGYIYALTVDPTPTPTVVYAGTLRDGIFKTNADGSWSQANAGLTNTAVYALAIDASTTPATAYAGTGNAVFKSTQLAGQCK